MRFLLQITHKAFYATGFLFWSAVVIKYADFQNASIQKLYKLCRYEKLPNNASKKCVKNTHWRRIVHTVNTLYRGFMKHYTLFKHKAINIFEVSHNLKNKNQFWEKWKIKFWFTYTRIARLQKNTRQVFSSFILHFSCLQINKFQRGDTQYINTIDN